MIKLCERSERATIHIHRHTKKHRQTDLVATILTPPSCLQAISKSKKKSDVALLLDQLEQEKTEMQTQQQGLLENLAEVGAVLSAPHIHPSHIRFCDSYPIAPRESTRNAKCLSDSL